MKPSDERGDDLLLLTQSGIGRRFPTQFSHEGVNTGRFWEYYRAHGGHELEQMLNEVRERCVW